jgi:ubiquinol-cytochrome c reductase cytochrome b subunit
MRSADGGYSERHLPLSESRAYTLSARERDEVVEEQAGVDANGVAPRGSLGSRARARLSRLAYGDAVPKPTRAELDAARHHGAHVREAESELEHPAAGHEFDDHALRDADKVPLRSGRDGDHGG